MCSTAEKTFPTQKSHRFQDIGCILNINVLTETINLYQILDYIFNHPVYSKPSPFLPRLLEAVVVFLQNAQFDFPGSLKKHI